jgi:hypothetical protein
MGRPVALHAGRPMRPCGRSARTITMMRNV